MTSTTIPLATIMPADMPFLATMLMTYPPDQRRVECRRIIKSAIDGCLSYARGEPFYSGRVRYLYSAILVERDDQAARGVARREWGHDPIAHMSCMAIACEEAVYAMQDVAVK